MIGHECFYKYVLIECEVMRHGILTMNIIMFNKDICMYIVFLANFNPDMLFAFYGRAVNW